MHTKIHILEWTSTCKKNIVTHNGKCFFRSAFSYQHREEKGSENKTKKKNSLGQFKKQYKNQAFFLTMGNKQKKGANFIPFFVGFDIANMAGLVEVEPLRASNTCKYPQHPVYISGNLSLV
jgi:hypothetical protein